MIYIVYKSKGRWSSDSIHEFGTEKEAIEWLQDKPRIGIIGIFKGEKLEAKIGETKVVKKVVTAFEVAQPERAI